VSYFTLGDKTMRDQVDAACFCGHYATPIPGWSDDERDLTCLGMQFAPRKLSTNLTLTLHTHLIAGYVPKSETGVSPMWAVELHYLNAWHFLTGFVEVNLQESPGNALEHPMWIMVPRQGYLGNKLYLGVNKLFADYSPQLHKTISSRVDVEQRRENAGTADVERT